MQRYTCGKKINVLRLLWLCQWITLTVPDANVFVLQTKIRWLQIKIKVSHCLEQSTLIILLLKDFLPSSLYHSIPIYFTTTEQMEAKTHWKSKYINTLHTKYQTTLSSWLWENCELCGCWENARVKEYLQKCRDYPFPHRKDQQLCLYSGTLKEADFFFLRMFLCILINTVYE